jgi:uncharacterized membrane protein SirB2
MDYLAIRTFHECAVALSVTGFAVRGAAALQGAGWVRAPLARTLPQVVDTALLASALTLVALAHVNPFTTPWLQAKLTGVVLYIVLGVIALRPGLKRGPRAAAWLAALLTAAWIVSVAFSKDPRGFLAALG